MRQQYNDHHLNYNRRDWTMHRIARKIREHPGMIVHKLYIPTHNRLHQEIGPIKPPSEELGLIVLSHLRQLDISDGREGALLHADHLWELSKEDSELGDEAYKYARHMEDQIEFLQLGKEVA